jgi:hypothetical protein
VIFAYLEVRVLLPSKILFCDGKILDLKEDRPEKKKEKDREKKKGLGIRNLRRRKRRKRWRERKDRKDRALEEGL